MLKRPVCRGAVQLRTCSAPASVAPVAATVVISPKFSQRNRVKLNGIEWTLNENGRSWRLFPRIKSLIMLPRVARPAGKPANNSGQVKEKLPLVQKRGIFTEVILLSLHGEPTDCPILHNKWISENSCKKIQFLGPTGILLFFVVVFTIFFKNLFHPSIHLRFDWLCNESGMCVGPCWKRRKKRTLHSFTFEINVRHHALCKKWADPYSCSTSPWTLRPPPN